MLSHNTAITLTTDSPEDAAYRARIALLQAADAAWFAAYAASRYAGDTEAQAAAMHAADAARSVLYRIIFNDE